MYYKTFTQPTPSSNLSFEMINRDCKSQSLRAQATETQHVIAFAHDLVLEMFDAVGSDHNKIIVNLMKWLLGFYRCFGTSPLDADYASKCCNSFLKIDGSLSREATKSEHGLRQITPTCHMMAELGCSCMLSATQVYFEVIWIKTSWAIFGKLHFPREVQELQVVAQMSCR